MSAIVGEESFDLEAADRGDPTPSSASSAWKSSCGFVDLRVDRSLVTYIVSVVFSLALFIFILIRISLDGIEEPSSMFLIGLALSIVSLYAPSPNKLLKLKRQR